MWIIYRIFCPVAFLFLMDWWHRVSPPDFWQIGPTDLILFTAFVVAFGGGALEQKYS